MKNGSEVCENTKVEEKSRIRKAVFRYLSYAECVLDSLLFWK